MDSALLTAPRPHRPVPAGATLGRMKIARGTADRLILKETRKFMWGVIAGGFICTAIVYVGWMIYLKELHDNIPLKILCIPLAGPLVVALGALLLYRHKSFDRKRRGVLNSRMFMKAKFEPWDAFKHVQVTVNTPNASACCAPARRSAWR